MVRVLDVAGFFVSVIGACVATDKYTCGESGQEACEDAQVEQQKVSMLQYRSTTENMEPNKRRASLLAEIAAIDAELDGLRDNSSQDGERSLYDIPCETDTHGTCRYSDCYDWRGPTDCIHGHCICKPGYCSRLGRCEPNDLTPSYHYTKIQDAACSENEYDTRLTSWTSGSVKDAEEACNKMTKCKGVHYSGKNHNYVLVPMVETTTENTNGPNECYAKTGMPAPRMRYPKLQYAFCSEDEIESGSRLTGWTKGDMQKAEMECNKIWTCKGVHYNVPNANYVLVSKVGTTTEDTNGGNECYVKPA